MPTQNDGHYKSLDFNLGMVRYADAKAAALFTFLLYIGSLVLVVFKEQLKIASTCEGKFLLFSFIAVASITFTIAALSLIYALWPKTNLPLPKTNLFCNNISEKGFEQFEKEISTTDFDYQKDIINQIYANAKIATDKYKKIDNAIPCVLILLLTVIICKIIY